MKKSIINLLFLLVLLTCFAQKEDYVWLSGYNSKDSLPYGTSVLTFTEQSMSIGYDTLGINFSKTNTSYSNADGNLLFYTNGIQVRNSLDEIIENADSLNWGWLITNFAPSIAKGGYRTTQGIFSLPSSAITGQHYIFNTFVDSTFGGLSIAIPQIRYHLLDMNANVGHGQMIERDKVALNGNLAGWEMATIKHGNGRDWWVFAREIGNNCYYRLLLDPNGIHVLPKICGGAPIPQGDLGSFATSPDGSKLVHFSIISGINIFNFDRCNGDLSTVSFIPLTIFQDSGWTANGAAISPNNRFLYIGATKVVLQYDLQAADIAASVDTVAIYDGFQAPFGSFFHTMQLGADGKIYESCGNGERVYHVIEQPDKKGDSCMFKQHEVLLPTYSLGVPNFPNYRLGTLPGSPCDTLSTGTKDEGRGPRAIQVYPNPASEYVVIDYAGVDWGKGELHLSVYDTKGAVIHQQPLPMYSGFQKITCTQWPSGVYQAAVKRGETIIATGRVVKQ